MPFLDRTKGHFHILSSARSFWCRLANRCTTVKKRKTRDIKRKGLYSEESEQRFPGPEHGIILKHFWHRINGAYDHFSFQGDIAFPAKSFKPWSWSFRLYIAGRFFFFPRHICSWRGVLVQKLKKELDFGKRKERKCRCRCRDRFIYIQGGDIARVAGRLFHIVRQLIVDFRLWIIMGGRCIRLLWGSKTWASYPLIFWAERSGLRMCTRKSLF